MLTGDIGKFRSFALENTSNPGMRMNDVQIDKRLSDSIIRSMFRSSLVAQIDSF